MLERDTIAVPVSQSTLIVVLVLVALLAANLPFVNARWFAIGPRHRNKHLGWRLAEWLIAFFVFVLLGRFMEGWIGQVAPQGWAFYAVLLCLFATLAFPGFVYSQLLKRKRA